MFFLFSHKKCKIAAQHHDEDSVSDEHGDFADGNVMLKTIFYAVKGNIICIVNECELKRPVIWCELADKPTKI